MMVMVMWIRIVSVRRRWRLWYSESHANWQRKRQSNNNRCTHRSSNGEQHDSDKSDYSFHVSWQDFAND